MASKTYFIKEEDLVCAICLDCWVGNDPRILPCQHTFCFKCIHQFSSRKQKIICAVCKAEYDVKDKKIENLKKNLLNEKIQRIDKKDYKKDEICEKHNKESSLFCETHNLENLCSDCFQNEHENCKISTMKKKLDILTKLLNNEKQQRDKAMKEIQEKQDEFLEATRMKFENIKKKATDIFNKRENKICKLSKEKTLFNNVITNIRKELSKNFRVNIMTTNVTCEIDYFDDVEQKLSVKKMEMSIFDKFVENNLQFRSLSFYEFDKKFVQSCIRIKLIEEKDSFVFYTAENPKIFNLNIIFNNFSQIAVFHMNFHNFSLKEFELICSSLSKSSNKLNELIFIGCDLTENQGKLLGNLLMTCTHIVKFYICFDKKIKNGWEDICKGLKKSVNYLKELNFNGCNLNEYQSGLIADLLDNCSLIESIDLSWNKEMKIGFNKVCNSLIKSSNKLSAINFQTCNLSGNQSKFMGKVLLHCSQLKKIELGWNKDIESGFNEILSGLATSFKTIEEINFIGCDLADHTRLHSLFQKAPKIKHINF